MHQGLDEAIRQIEAAELHDGEQEAFRHQILAFCADHSDALLRSCLSGHLTGSAAIVDPTRKAALVMHHVKLDRWLQPGGHADGDGDLAAVALREAQEETGLDGLEVIRPAIDLDVHRIPARPGEPEHLHLDVRFLVRCEPGATPSGNHESHGLAWWSPFEEWSPSEMQPDLDDSTARLLRRGLDAVLAM